MVRRAVPLAVAVGGMMLLIPVPTQALAQLSPAAGPSAAARADIPPPYLTLYIRAARTCPGLPWQVLAAIGSIESDHGRSAAPGVHAPTGHVGHAGYAGYAGPEGPMQFEPATFAAYAVRADRAHAVSPYNPADAIYTAARMLCATGARGGSQSGLYQAIYAYNHAGWYVNAVLNLAARYSGPAVRPKPGTHPGPTRSPATGSAKPRPPTHPAPVQPSQITGTTSGLGTPGTAAPAAPSAPGAPATSAGSLADIIPTTDASGSMSPRAPQSPSTP